MLSNQQRIKLVRRLQVLSKEMEDIAYILSTNAVPITDEDIDRGVAALLDQNATIVLSSLSRQTDLGIPNTVLAIYFPKASKDRLKAYASETGSEALLVFQRMLDANQFTVVKGDEDADSFCLQLEFLNQNENNSRLIMTRTEPAQAMVQIGPRRIIRQKMDDETLNQHLIYTHVDRADLEHAVLQAKRTLSDLDVVWFHVDVTHRQAADRASG